MFKKSRYRMSVLKKLFTYSHGVRRDYVMMVVVSVFMTLTTFITPMLYKIFVDDVIIERKIELMKGLVAGYFLLFLINTLLSVVYENSNKRFTNLLLFKVRHRILGNYLTMPFENYSKRSLGELKIPIDDDLQSLKDFVSVQSIEYGKSLITFSIAMGFMFFIEWRLAILGILMIPLTFFLEHVPSHKENGLKKINYENTQRWHSWMVKSTQYWKEVKTLNIYDSQLGKYSRFNHNFAQYYSRWINYWVLRVKIIPRILDDFFMKFVLYFLGGLLILNNKITIGELLVFALYSEMLNRELRFLSQKDGDLQSQQSIYNRVLDGMDRKPVGQKLQLSPAGNGIIEFSHVSFSYTANLPSVVENLSFTIQRGERVAITGPSGRGKTTVLKMICGMLSPQVGSVHYSGRDISGTLLRSLHSKIGFVMQENLLLNRSIKENLLLANPHSNQNDLERACEKACILEWINSQDKGFDTSIGESGVQLSGGQRQRIVLARLFLRDVDVIILDEATSSVDRYSESLIHDSLEAIGRDKTLIIVSHRSSSLELCHRVIEL